MDSFQLPFATIKILRDDIAEVMINEGIEMDLNRVEQFHAFLLSHLRAPFSLLINKINAYSYDFQAQEKLLILSELNAIAVVAYDRKATFSTKTLASFPREKEWNLKIFSNREDALAWLISERRQFRQRDDTKSTAIPIYHASR